MFDFLSSNLPWLGVLVVVIVAISLIARLYRMVPPNKALIIYGGRGSEGRGFQIVKGGGAIVLPFFQAAKELDLGLITLPLEAKEIPTQQGVMITALATVQVKVGGTNEMIATAAEQFLDKTVEDRNKAIDRTMTGHLRAILGTQTIEDINQGKETFNQQVRDMADPDMKRMGMEIISFTISHVDDGNTGYLTNLGAAKVAQVKREADIARAEATRDTEVRQAAAQQEARQAQAQAETEIAQAENTRDIRIQELRAQSEAKRATAEMAFELQQAQIQSSLATQQGQAEVVRQQQAAQAAEVQVDVARQQQIANIVAPAEAAREAARIEAEGRAQARKLNAEAEASATQVTAEAEATRIRATQLATAEGREANGKADGAAKLAGLMAEAQGQQALADALASQGQVNLLLKLAELALNAKVQQTSALATALGDMGNHMKVVQFGGNGSGSMGHPLMDTAMRIPELASMLDAKSDALTGLDLVGLLRTLKTIVSDPESAALLGAVIGNGHEAAVTTPDATADPVATTASSEA